MNALFLLLIGIAILWFGGWSLLALYLGVLAAAAGYAAIFAGLQDYNHTYPKAEDFE